MSAAHTQDDDSAMWLDYFAEKAPTRAVPHINFEFVYPPIPIRSLDWQATLDGYEGGDPIGRGATKEDAMVDLISQLEDKCCACSASLTSEQEQRNGVCDACL